jgi:hypothetical protein
MIKMIIPLAILLAIPNAVNADEPYAGYEQDRARAERSQGSYIKKVAWMSSCGPKITPAVCRRIQRDDKELRRGTRRESIYVAEPRRGGDYSSRQTRDRDYDRRDSGPGRCWREVIRAKGEQRPGIEWATRTAKEAWQREVRYDAGETYLSWRRADKIGGDTEPGIVCNESAITKLLKQYRCEAKARPCKGS